MIVRLAILVLSLPVLAVGIEILYHALRSPQQTSVTCEQFVRNRPAAAWLRLTNCEVDYVAAGFTETVDGRIQELFFPVRPVGQRRNERVAIVLATRDPEALATAEQTIGGERQPDQEQFLVMMLTIVTKLRASREIQGYARKTLIDVLRTRRALAGMSAPLDPHVVVVDLYRQPPLVLGGAATAVGALGLIASSIAIRRRRGRSRVQVIERGVDDVTDAAPPERAAASFAHRRLRGLMLLNLPPDAGPESIESAPPLGTRDEVMEKLAHTMPGIRANERGRCVFSSPDHSMMIDLGAREPIATGVVEVEGDGAVAALRALVERTGWRIFVPRRGEFVEPAALDSLWN